MFDRVYVFCANLNRLNAIWILTVSHYTRLPMYIYVFKIPKAERFYDLEPIWANFVNDIFQFCRGPGRIAFLSIKPFTSKLASKNRNICVPTGVHFILSNYTQCNERKLVNVTECFGVYRSNNRFNDNAYI